MLLHLLMVFLFSVRRKNTYVQNMKPFLKWELRPRQPLIPAFNLTGVMKSFLLVNKDSRAMKSFLFLVRFLELSDT